MIEARLVEVQALDPAPPGLQDFQRALPVLPLFHRLGEPLRDGDIILEVADTKAGRKAIGTDCCLFASVGVAAYLTPPLVLAFGPMEEPRARTGRTSAPWDTRELGAVLGGLVPVSQHVADWSAEAPKDESFLAHYLARCFAHLHDWLAGGRPTGQDVLGVLAALDRSARAASGGADLIEERRIRMTTPEARYRIPVKLSEGLLLAAFADVDHAVGTPAEGAWAKSYRVLEGMLGDDFYRLRRTAGAPDLRATAYRFVQEMLATDGVV